MVHQIIFYQKYLMKNQSYDAALKEAQDLGFAENWTLFWMLAVTTRNIN